MSSIERIVIIGAGLAGARAAEALRKDGFDGSITLVGDEPDRPYLRPPLSKEYLRGESDREKVYVHPDSFYVEQRIDLRTGSAARSDRRRLREVVLDDGERLRFDRLLIATGARRGSSRSRARICPASSTFRTSPTRTRCAKPPPRPSGSSSSAPAGSGARSAPRFGCSDASRPGRSDAVPLERALGPEIGACTATSIWRTASSFVRHIGRQHHRDRSRPGGRDRSRRADRRGPRRRGHRRRAAGRARPQRGLAVGDGIEVSATLETSVPGIFAAGDVASAWHPFYSRRLRTEHWANASSRAPRQGR